MVGDHVRRFPALARRVVSEGHMVGNHTHNHVKLHLAAPSRIRAQLDVAHAAIEWATGQTPRAFRAPHGIAVCFSVPRRETAATPFSDGRSAVFDTARPGVEEIRRRVRKRLRPGAIVLLHDGDGYDPEGDRMQTAKALPGIIEDAQAAGYGFGS